MVSGRQLHILLVEDNPDHAEMILRCINRAGGNPLDAEHAASLAKGVAALPRREWDAVLLDLQLPDSGGLQTLDTMLRHAAAVPVIVLTSLGDEDLATMALQQGAQDYLVKDDFTSEVLARTIRYAIERKRIEGRLKSSLAELANRAQELEQLNRRLAEQNADLDNFNHMISHDLREPIRHLMLFSQRLQSNATDGLSEKACRDLHLVHAAALRMESSIAGLQTLSQASQRDVRRARVSLDFCLRSALAELERAISERQAVVSFGALPDVEADPTLLALLLRNLISNALQYCRGQPVVHITAQQTGKQWVYGVRDSGIGIDPCYLDRIFTPFERLHGREEYGGGSGLGLAICRKIVAGHGGRIWVDSKPGEGAHFLFTLCPEAAPATCAPNAGPPTAFV